MALLTPLVNFISSVVVAGSNVDMFAATNNIKLGVLLGLLMLEMFWSVLWMLIIKRGVTVGMSMWFIGTFVLVVVGCGYVLSCVLYTRSLASGVPFWLWGYLSGISG